MTAGFALAGCPSGLKPMQHSEPLPELANPSVRVEKSARRLIVFDNGRPVKMYPCCTGRVAGDKRQAGDLRTPEGRFYICYKNPLSKFTLSLGLSYPNEEDAERGLRDGLITPEQHDGIVAALRDGGKPDWYTPLGGEIMIHGAGANREGTAGCVGLNDDDIRDLYPRLPCGTPVTIVP